MFSKKTAVFEKHIVIYLFIGWYNPTTFREVKYYNLRTILRCCILNVIEEPWIYMMISFKTSFKTIVIICVQKYYTFFMILSFQITINVFNTSVYYIVLIFGYGVYNVVMWTINYIKLTRWIKFQHKRSYRTIFNDF